MIFDSEVRQTFTLYGMMQHMLKMLYTLEEDIQVVDVRKSVHSSRPSEQNYPLDN